MQNFIYLVVVEPDENGCIPWIDSAQGTIARALVRLEEIEGNSKLNERLSKIIYEVKLKNEISDDFPPEGIPSGKVQSYLDELGDEIEKIRILRDFGLDNKFLTRFKMNWI